MKKLIKVKNHLYVTNTTNKWGILFVVAVCIIAFIAIGVALTHNNKPETTLPPVSANVSTGSSDQGRTGKESGSTDQSSGNTSQNSPCDNNQQDTLYKVVSVIDGDTIKVNYNGATTSVRLIGVNTPETVDPRKSVECFGVEASNYLKNLLSNKQVKLEADSSQTDRDKYDRLLRYVYLDNEDVNLKIIADGYGYEYTYNVPYLKQAEYKAAQSNASANGYGLWAPDACSVASAESQAQQEQPQESQSPAQECSIKGNISNKGEKIYHVPGQRYYDKTVIDTSKGERMFCTEQEAIDAGWRKSKV